MKFKQLHKTLLLPLCAALLTACSDEVLDSINPDAGKTAIELSVGGVDRADGVTTRTYTGSAVITKEETGMIAFPENTNIFMVMQSEYDTSNPDFIDPDDTGQDPAHKLKTTVARGFVTKGQTAVSFDDINKRYWDDAHGRSTQLTIWAFAQMYKTNWTQCKFQKVVNSDATDWSKFQDVEYNTSSTTYDWRQDDVYPGIKEWNVTHLNNGYHDETSVLCQDLLFSNNIANNTDYSKGDNRLKFNKTSKQFPRDNKLYFRHAMSKITIHIKKGEGFGEQFAFTTGNVKLSGFNRKGAFNIKEGEFQWIWDYESIPQIYLHNTPNDGDAFTLEALAIPNIHKFGQAQTTKFTDGNSRFTSDGTNVMMEFTIEGNKYEITSKQLYNALHVDGNPSGSLVTNAVKYTDNGTYIPLEAGKNYDFTLTIGKTKIDNISATVVPWVDVITSPQLPENSYISLELKTTDNNPVTGTPTFDFYLVPDPTTYTGGNDYASYNAWAQYNWGTGYKETNNKAVVTEKTAGSGIYTTERYWPDNHTFYHFRTISKNSSIEAATNDYTTLTAGNIVDDINTTGFNDYVWGAPFKDKNGDLNYSFTDGYNASTTSDAKYGQIYKAIGATKETIFFYQMHMMSDVMIDLVNQTQGQVNITDATVELVNVATSANLQMGNALVTEHTYSTSPVSMKADHHDETSLIPEYDYSYRLVPQELTHTSDGSEVHVGLKITCKDNNVYIINDLSTVKDLSEKIIDKWEPGKRYYYKFVLLKTGIQALKATICDWQNVTASPENITIK